MKLLEFNHTIEYKKGKENVVVDALSRKDYSANAITSVTSANVEEFVTQCAVFQRAKSEHCQYPGLLAPLPIPTLAWTFISVDFVEGWPKSGTKNSILVVVDRLTKYSHFSPLSHPFTTQTVTQLFIENVFKLHGIPVAIVTDRDRNFTSKLWKVSPQYSSTYHPKQMGRLNESINAWKVT
jgi:hypothetical protein